ncbi:MAG: DNA translocase FtsK [Ruminococcaceae bacterium]|nr:DNA translocase FtsK [Oscillospiraceae bacterium]
MRKYKGRAQENTNEKSTTSKILHFVSVLMPYILAVLFVFVLFSLFGFLDIKTSEETTLKIGSFLIAPLKILFSGAGTVFVAIALLYHAFVWKSDVKHRICIRRVICTLISAISVSTLQHIIQFDKYHVDYSIKYIFDISNNGLHLHGGGIIGALLGDFMLAVTHELVAIALLLIILVFMILQMFNITPVTMVQAVISKIRNSKGKEPKPKKEKPKKEKKVKKGKMVKVFDDSKDEMEKVAEKRIVKANSNTSVALDIRKYIEEEQATYESVEYDDSGDYENLDDVIVSSRFSSSDQVKPYDKDYLRKKLEAADELDVEVTPVYDDLEPPIDDLENDEYAFGGDEFVDDYFKKLKEEEEEDTRQQFGDRAPVQKEEDDEFEFDNPVLARERMLQGDKKKEETSLDDFEIVSEPLGDGSFDVPIEDFEDEDFSEASLKEIEKEGQKPADKFDYLDELIDNAKKTVDPNKAAETLNNDFVDNSNCIPLDHKGEKKTLQPPPKKKAIKRNYKFPPIQYLQEPVDNSNSVQVKAELQENAKIIVEALNEFKVWTKISDITRGPTVTRYELVPEPGVRVRSIASLSDDIKLKLAAEDIRMECPVPGKSAVGIEVPNKVASMVYLRDLIDCPQFKKAKGKLTCALGKSISGENIYVDIEKTPHLLVAGATGMGKSVCINSLLVSLLYRTTPDDVRLILVDPKKVELSNYNGVPHLLVPVVVEPKKALGALQWAVTEMENRFETIEAAGVRNLIEFNEKVDKGYDADKMSRIVIVIDELADLKMQVPDIDQHITRLTQKARAAGIHIIIGTQRPSVDVITGLIKSNIPSRISFRVPSQIDSRTVLDEVGAERLVSRGDMLVKIVGSLYPVRVQGSFVAADEIEEVINFWKENTPAIYDEDVMHQIEANAAKSAKNDKGSSAMFDGEESDDELDSVFYEALGIAVEEGKISSSYLQRRLRLGFQRAARLIDQMEDCGYIGEQNGSKPREVLISKEEYHEIMMRRSDD